MTDTAGAQVTTWTAPIMDYTDIQQSFSWFAFNDRKDSSMEFEVIALRHPDPSKTLYLSGTRKAAMGGMSFSEMIQAGKEGRKDDIVAAVGDTRNPAVEAFVAALVDETGLPLVQDF